MWMRSFLLTATAAVAVAQSPKYGVGKAAPPEVLKNWDISVLPDGTGLPAGSGTAKQGADIFASKCAKCHGQNGQGADEGPLAGGKGSLATPKPLKTVGSYWPYATTVFDYVNRAMPFKDPGSLTSDQVYAVVAHVLRLNGIAGENDVMDAKSLPKVMMPNRDGFIRDPRVTKKK